jgi:LAO/AO transport system kinase
LLYFHDCYIITSHLKKDESIMTVLDEFFAGQKLALSKIISHIENDGPQLRELLPILYDKAGRAYKVGLTGPPGAGKSTLVDKLAELYAEGNHQVGIIAVDPSSPFTGGALLGDRIRMQNLAAYPNIFIRSMATRGSTGGLAASTGEVAMAMDAFGKETILIETVGVGQVELDIADSCDTTVVVLVPESGDSIQALKAGLMEIADIFVINKADRPGASKMASELSIILDFKKQKTGWEYPVVKTEAVNEIGIDELKDKIAAHREFLSADSRNEYHRRRKIKTELSHILDKRLKAHIAEHILTEDVFNKYIEQIRAGELNPYDAVDRIITTLMRDIANGRF